MTKLNKTYLLFLILFVNSIFAQKKVFEQNGYNLNFTNNDSTLNDSLNHKLVNTFFTVYPKLVQRFNANASKYITFIIDPNYEGVAATWNDTTIFNSKWFDKYPNDIDVVTHEVMHIVQAYPNESGPWWITEGIADYVRYKYGVYNDEANWKLVLPKQDQNYNNSYRITARFFVWLEKYKDNNMIDILDSKMRKAVYTENIWTELTGKNIDELWQEYLKNPEL